MINIFEIKNNIIFKIEIIIKIIFILNVIVILGFDLMLINFSLKIKISVIEIICIWELKLDDEMIFGIIDATIVNKIISPPTIIRNRENPNQEFFVILEIIILIIIDIKINERINFLGYFFEFINVFIIITIIVINIIKGKLYIANENF